MKLPDLDTRGNVAMLTAFSLPIILGNAYPFWTKIGLIAS